MNEVTLASQVRDWLTVAAIVIGGLWAIWRFGHSEWLRWRAEIPSLEGNSSAPEILVISPGSTVASLRWTWRNAGTRPLYIDTKKSRLEIYRLPPEIVGVIDPRQQKKKLSHLLVTSHYPLSGFDPYFFEPGTSSSLLTPVVLPVDKSYLARMVLYPDSLKHPAGGVWERWQLFSSAAGARSASEYASRV